MNPLEQIAKKSRDASHILASASTKQKNDALSAIIVELCHAKSKVLESNEQDKKDAAANPNLSDSLIKRLDLSGAKYETLLQGIRDVRQVEDPVGVVSLAREIDHELELYRVSCPIGVLCIIFESRPEAAVQISSLAIKSGNAVILKGGKEALHSNQILVECIRKGLKAANLPEDCVQLVETREDVGALLKLDTYIDLVIPRGSNALVRSVMNSTNIPVMGHADGICAVYLDKDADETIAGRVVVDAKTNYTAACNAAETLLVHTSLVSTLLPKVGKLLADKGVKFHADAKCLPYLPKACTVAATDADFRTEYLGLEIAVKAVGDVEEAIQHINEHGSHHTDVIITENNDTAERFLQAVGSADVFHNASSRFADGFRFGFGAEVGIATSRIHARGPVGLDGLLIYKYRLHGRGHCAGDYGVGENQKQYLHRTIAYDDTKAPKAGTFAAGKILKKEYIAAAVIASVAILGFALHSKQK